MRGVGSEVGAPVPGRGWAQDVARGVRAMSVKLKMSGAVAVVTVGICAGLLTGSSVHAEESTYTTFTNYGDKWKGLLTGN